MDITMDKPPRDLNLSSLAECCSREIQKYSRKEPHDDQYCLEIFRRAMLQHDGLAWELVQRRFGEMVVGWIRRHPSRETIYAYDSEENYVAQTFARFWMATVHNQELEFATLAAALRYLHATLNGVILDKLRAYSRSKESPLPDPGFAGEPAATEYDDGSELWTAIKGMLPDKREQRAAFLLYHCGLKPREIVERCAQEFSTVQEVYRLRRNILERLTRNKERLRWLLSDE
ncbi:MAG: hypothetical protein M3Z24_13240 [Chloroflexota bacterium]|nr:hypothetical protein [Chloroflexota bacterium]